MINWSGKVAPRPIADKVPSIMSRTSNLSLKRNCKKKGEKSNHRNLRSEIDHALSILDARARDMSLAAAQSDAKTYVQKVTEYSARYKQKFQQLKH